MIYCVWYPGGGFGHFINAVLTLYGNNFVRPNKSLKFSNNGNSHNLDLVAPKYFHNNKYPNFDFDPLKNYSVLIDNGIGDSSKRFVTTFVDSSVIKMCYNNISWPIVAKTNIVKASKSTIESELSIDSQWPDHSDWAVREKYTLYLKEHSFKSAWLPDKNTYNIDILTLINYKDLYYQLSNIVDLANFEELHKTWIDSNFEYFFPVIEATTIVKYIQNQTLVDLTHITSLWDQAVINYFIELEFDIEIPVNDYANWFQNTKQIIDLI
jgi:hypothetical protein